MLLPICNQKPNRAPRLFGHTFFLCWRCTMAAMAIIVTLFFTVKYNITLTKSAFAGCLLCLPMIVDGFLQYFVNIISTNLRRAVTGALFGTGVAILIVWFINDFI